MTLRTFTLALIQLGNISHNKTDNLTHARELIIQAARGSETGKQPDLIVLPEYFNSPIDPVHLPAYAERIGYVPGKSYDITESPSETVKMLSSAAKEVKRWIVGGSIPEKDDDKLYNTCTVYDPEGNLVAMHRKVHLFDIDIPGKIKYKESELITAGSSLTSFETGFAKIGLGICYDIRFPEMAMIAARQGCHVLIYPAAFNLTTGPLHWELLQRARAVDNQVFVSMCSPARDMNAKYLAWGHSMVLDPMARVLAEAGEDEEIVYAEVVPDVLTNTRAWIPVTVQRRFDVYSEVRELPN